jgi:hypothetical protein
MNSAPTNSDDAFEPSLSVQQAYLCMFEFLRQHYERGPTDEIGGLLGSLSLLADGASADPALMSDWLDAVNRVLEAESDGGYRDARMRLQ